MANDLKIQGVVEVSTEGVESALNRVGTTADGMARKIEASAATAGKAVDSIGSGADKSANEFTRAEGKIVASIKRATTQLELLGKTASQRLEFKINTQGLDASKFEPALAKLRELEAAQVRVGTAGRGMGQGLQNTSYQLQDFIVQVNGGVDATRALSMQLPQMLVGFGAAGAAIGVVAALLPNLVSAFSDAGEGAKDFKGAMSDFDKAIGNVGSTVKTFDMEALYEQFNKSSAAVRAATIEQLNFQQEYIRTTQIVAGKKFGESLGGLGEFGGLDRLAGAFAGSGAEKLAGQLGLSVEVAKDLLPVLNGLKTGTQDVNEAFGRFGTVLLGGNAKAVELAATMNELAKSERDGAAAASAISEAQAKMAAGHVLTKKEAEALAKAQNTVAKETEALADLLDAINGKSSQFDSSYVKNVNLLLTAYGNGKLSLDQFNEAFGRYVAMQPGAVASAKELAKAEQEAEKNRQEYTRAIGDETAKLLDKAKASEDELSMIGLSAEQIAVLTARRYDEQIAIKQAEADRLRGIDGREAEVYLIEQQISALQRLKNAEVTKPQLKAQADAWQNFTRDIERSLTDALMRSFESGDSFGKAFAKNLQNLFKTMVLKVAIQGTVNAGMNAVGLGGSPGGADLLGLAQNGAGIYSNLTGGGIIGSLAGSSAAYGAALGTTSIGAGSQAAMLAAQTAEFGTAGLSATASAAGSTSMATVASAAPYVAAAVAAYMLADSMFGSKGGPKTQIYGGSRANDWGIAATAPISAELDALAKSVETSFADIVAGFGKSYAATVAIGGDADPQGSASSRSGYFVSANGVDRFSEIDIANLDAAAMQATATRALLAALEAVDINGVVNQYLDDLNIEGLSEEQAAAAVATVQSFNQVASALDAMGLGADALTSELVAASGGISSLQAMTGAYFDAFYTESEKTAVLQKNLAEQFDKIGVAMPDTISGFRQIVDSLDLTTASGQETFVAMMGLSSAFAQVAGSARSAEASERSQRLAYQRELEAKQAEELAARVEAFSAGKADFDAMTNALMLAGDAAGYVSAQMNRAFADPLAKGLPEWIEGTTAASFNFAYGSMLAQMNKVAAEAFSANALRVSNVGGALSSLGTSAISGQYSPLVSPVYAEIRKGIADAAGDVGDVIRDAVDGASLFAAQAAVRQQYTAGGPGLTGIYAAQAAAQSAGIGGFVGGMYQFGEDVLAYGKSLDRLDGALKAGTISADQYAKAVEGLNSAIPSAVELFGDVEAQMARIAAAQDEVVRAGFGSISYYFGQIGTMTAELAASAKAAGEAISVATEAIGRMNSTVTVFSTSAQAAMTLGADRAALFGNTDDIQKSLIIAEAASIASSVLTTSDAAAAAKRLAESDAFAGLTQAGIRDAALLLDGVSQYNVQGFENAFLRINDALITGAVTQEQYQALFSTAIETFNGLDEEAQAAAASMKSLADAMASFADQLLIGDGTTLTGAQTLAEIRAQYDVAKSLAATGDSTGISQFQALSRSMLDQGLYANRAEYNAAFGMVYGDARSLESIGAGFRPDSVVTELQALNSNLTDRVERLESNLSAALAVIARNTAKTSDGIQQINTVGLPA